MSLKFDWSILNELKFDKSFLTCLINRAKKPSTIIDDLIVDDLDLGSQSPNMDIKDIEQFDDDRFRGTVRFQYNGDAVLKLHTFVEIDSLSAFSTKCPPFAQPAPILGACGLRLPVEITLSNIDISCDIIIAYQQDKGVAVVVVGTPLNSVQISSSLDFIEPAKQMIQKQIHTSIQEALIEDIPPEISKTLTKKDSISEKSKIPTFTSRDHQVSIWQLASSFVYVIRYLINGIIYQSASAAMINAQLEYHSQSLSIDPIISANYLSRSMTSSFEPNLEYRPQTPKSSNEHRGATHTMKLNSGSIFNTPSDDSRGSLDEPLTPISSPARGPTYMQPLSPDLEVVSRIKSRNRRLIYDKGGFSTVASDS